MPENPNSQQYDIEELENAAAFAVSELEKVTELFQMTAGLNITVHSPEASWSDPVQVLETARAGGLYARIHYPEGPTALLISHEDASFLTGVLLGLPAAEVQVKVKAGIKEDETDLLAGVLHQTFAPAGAVLDQVSLYSSDKQLSGVVESDFGVSFLTVRTAASPEGYSDFGIVRIYSRQFSERFGARPGTSSFDTMAVPSAAATGPFTGVEEEETELFAPQEPKHRPRPRELLRDIPVTLRVTMASRRVTLRELLEMLPGNVIEFEQKINEPVTVVVNNHAVASGEAVRTGRKFGVRIHSVLPVEKRVNSLSR